MAEPEPPALAADLAPMAGAPADAPALSLADLVGDLPPAPEPSPAPSAKLGPHRCLRRTLIRDGYEAFSSVLGALEEGDVVRVVEERALEIGASRLRFERVRTPPHPASACCLLRWSAAADTRRRG